MLSVFESAVEGSAGSGSEPRRRGVEVPRFERVEVFCGFEVEPVALFLEALDEEGACAPDRGEDANAEAEGITLESKKCRQALSVLVAANKTCFSYLGST